MTAGPAAQAITGLVLAGGRGRRMGGVDKGLAPYRGRPLVAHAILRLAPQVREIMISANRNVAIYESFGARVLADACDDFAGPLAGILAGLRAARTPWLAVVPCDAPHLPNDLVARLAHAVAAGPEFPGAVVRRGGGPEGPRLEPVCCLLSKTLGDDLQRTLAEGRRKVEPWIARHATPVPFDRPEDARAFANLNTRDELDA
ncbi:MAG: molybdenum cofactor guanylyltransferase MobA [Burkholderiaceae bacterium]